jgi:endo-1,4-beta-D-glucanase Y
MLSALLLTLPACASAAERRAVPRDPAADRELQEWWSAFKTVFVLEDGRVYRPTDGGDTVSEAQSYTMLFAVLLGDRPTFDRVHQWTMKELSRTNLDADHLLGWHWRNGAVTDWNSAADADLDYTLALILAHRRWGEEKWMDEARLMATDVITHETRRRDDLLFLIPGVWGDDRKEGLWLNASYFSPANYRFIERISDAPEWPELAEDTYKVWDSVSQYMGKRKGVGLIPDWCRYTPEGEYRSINVRAWTYGWEALRYPLRVGMDALLWDHEPARKLLREGPCAHFTDWFAKGNEHAAAVYDYDGRPWDGDRSLAMTSMALFAFQAAGEDPPDKLVASFEQQRRDPFFNRNYYALSMVFFPLAYRAGLLTPELTEPKGTE